MTLLRYLQAYVGSGQTGGTETTYEAIVLVQAWRHWGTGKNEYDRDLERYIWIL